MLFQVHFLALLLEERGAGDLAAVAEHCSQKLIRRHPHVFGEVEAGDAAAVLRNWDAIKRAEAGREPGATGALPGNLPATIYARKVQRRAAAAGDPQPDVEAALARVIEEARRLSEAPATDQRPPEGQGAAPAAKADTGHAEGPTDESEAMRAAEDPVRGERYDSIGELLYGAVAAARELGVDAELALRAAADRRRERADAPSEGEERQP